jgi:hypothetical protein
MKVNPPRRLPRPPKVRAVRRMPEYYILNGMKQRCLNPKMPQWKDYGGRGIRVCERWITSFENFLADVGPRPPGKLKNGMALYSIDRFPDNDGNYEPGNVRWATPKEQGANKGRALKKP